MDELTLKANKSRAIIMNILNKHCPLYGLQYGL